MSILTKNSEVELNLDQSLQNLAVCITDTYTWETIVHMRMRKNQCSDQFSKISLFKFVKFELRITASISIFLGQLENWIMPVGAAGRVLTCYAQN